MQVFPALEIPSFGFLYIAVALNHIVGLELAAQENVLLVNEAVAHITERPEKLAMPLFQVGGVKRIRFGKLHQISDGHVAGFGKNGRTYRIEDTISL